MMFGYRTGAQGGFGYRGISTAIELLAETIAYRDRVEADGGEVTDIEFVDRFYAHAIEHGYLADIKHASSPQAGVKINHIDSVPHAQKLYDLGSEGNDASQGTASAQPEILANQLSGKAVLQHSDSTFLPTSEFSPHMSQPNALMVVVRYETSGQTYYIMDNDGGFGGRQLIGRVASPAAFRMWASSFVQGGTVELNAWVAQIGIFDDANSRKLRDNTQVASGAAGSNGAGSIELHSSDTSRRRGHKAAMYIALDVFPSQAQLDAIWAYQQAEFDL